MAFKFQNLHPGDVVDSKQMGKNQELENVFEKNSLKSSREVNETELHLKWPIMLNEDILNNDLPKLSPENQVRMRIFQ